MASNFWENDAVPTQAEPTHSGGDFWEHDAVPADTPKTSTLGAAVQGATQGATLGWGDEIAGGVNVALAKGADLIGAPNPYAGMSAADIYKAGRDAARKEAAQAQADHPVAYGASELAAGALPMLAAPEAAGVKGAAVIGAASGAIAGAGQSEGGTAGDLVKDAALGAGIGAGAGAAGHGVVQALSRAPEALSSLAESASARAQGFTKAMRNKFGNDVAAQIGRQGLDEGVVTPLASTETMLERNKALQQKSGQAIGDMYQTLDNVSPQNFSTADLAQSLDDKIIAPLRGQKTSSSAVKYLENVRDDIAALGEGSDGSFQSAQQVKQFLTDQINRTGGFNPVSPSEKNTLLRQAYKQVVGDIDASVDTAAESSGQPGLLDQFQANRQTYGNTKIAEKALSNKLSGEAGNKAIGLTDTIAGIGTFAAAHNPIVGAGVVAAKKLGEAYGSQTVAVGADRLADVVRNSAQMLGKYAPVLQQALQRGGPALAATNYLMQQQDPEYRAMVQNLGSGN